MSESIAFFIERLIEIEMKKIKKTKKQKKHRYLFRTLNTTIK